MIPKIAHFIWGSQPLSYMRAVTLISFVKFNPEWEVRFYRRPGIFGKGWVTWEELDSRDLRDRSDMIPAHIEPRWLDIDLHGLGGISDIHFKDLTNWRLLSTEGGAVFDMDMVFRGPVIFPDHADVVLYQLPTYYFPIACMASSAEGRPFFADVYAKALRQFRNDVYQSCGADVLGDRPIDEMRPNWPGLNIVQMPNTTVFPFDRGWEAGIRQIVDTRGVIPDDCFALHWYGNSPFGKDLCRIVHPGFYGADTTLSAALREVLECA